MLDFPDILRRIVHTQQAVDEDNAFADDLQTAFEAVREFAAVSVESVDGMVETFHVRVTVGQEARSLQGVVRQLEAALLEAMFPDFRLSTCAIFQDAIILRFLTSTSDERFTFAGVVAATGPTYQDLRAAFESEYYALASRTSEDTRVW